MNCKLEIVAGFKNKKSFLKNLYLTSPFRVIPVGQRKNDNHLYLMIMSSSPGILNDDYYDLNMIIENNSRLQVQSQSYQRLFNMDNEANQKLRINIGDNAFFSYVPHPIVPHENSTFKSKTNVSIGKRSRLLISEIITCGRKYYGELFKFTHFQNMMKIYHQGKMILKDNVILRPTDIPIDSIGILEGYTHQGMLAFLSTNPEDNLPALVELIYTESELKKDMQIGVSLVDKGFIVRALGQGGEKMHNFFLEIQTKLWNKK